MTYFDGDKSVDEKVVSVQMDVEEALGSLYAVAVCQIRDVLSSGELYVSFWKPDGFFIRTKEELETAKAHVRSRPQKGEDSR